MNSPWCNQRMLVLALALVLAQTGAHAEIGRVSLSAVLEQILTEERAFEAFEEVSFPAKELASRVPDMVQVVLSEDAKVEGDALKAIFAVKEPGAEVRERITVRMKLIAGRTYGVARWSKRTLRSWLLRRIDHLGQGNVVLENMVGIDAGSVSFRLSVAGLAEDLLALADTGSSAGALERVLEGILGRSITDGEFVEVNGGARRFAEFEQQTLLLNVWATWCAPCVAEMPALERLQDRHRDRGLTVVNLSDERVDVIRDWLSQNPSTMLHGRVDGFEFLLGDALPEGVDRSLGVRPVYVIVDRAGIVREVRAGVVKTVGPSAGDEMSDDIPEHHLAARLQPYLLEQ